MTIPLTQIERFLRRKASAKEREDLLRLQRAFNLHDDDSMWPILFALDYHKVLYANIPHAIEQASEGIVADAAKSLKAEVGASSVKAAASLKQAIAAAEEAARAIVRAEARIMACLFAAVVIVPILAAIAAWAAATHASVSCAPWPLDPS